MQRFTRYLLIVALIAAWLILQTLAAICWVILRLWPDTPQPAMSKGRKPVPVDLGAKDTVSLTDPDPLPEKTVPVLVVSETVSHANSDPLPEKTVPVLIVSETVSQNPPTIRALKKLAQQRGIPRYWLLKKSELIAALA